MSSTAEPKGPQREPHTSGEKCKKKYRTRRRPSNCVWTHQVIQTLSWLRSFLRRERGAVVRTWLLQHYMQEATDLTFLFDACPWGLGGILVQNGVIISYFISKLTAEDEKHLKVQRGSSKGQQTWETLAVLVGLRAWRRFWQHRRCTLAIKGDNKTALSVGLTLRAPAGPVNKLARELSFTYSSAAFEPRAATHVPGVTNVLSDSLSRKYDPSRAGSWRLPARLASVPEEKTAVRTAAFWMV